MMWPASKNGFPPAQGLYDPAHEHDACGIGFVASIRCQKSHDIIDKGIQVLINLTHRGACGCDPETGDGAESAANIHFEANLALPVYGSLRGDQAQVVHARQAAGVLRAAAE